MKRIITLALLLCLVITMPKAQTTSNFKVDISSAKLYLDMAQKASNGQMPSDEEWDSLFVSPAYKALFRRVDWNKKEFEDNVKMAFDIAYNPSKTTVRDSVAATLNDIELAQLDSELPLFVSTALSIKDNLNSYTSIVNDLSLDNVVDEANALAMSLLPDNGRGITPQACPIYFIVWDLECRSLGDALFLDVNTFFHDGPQSATEFLAHEMHHFYLMPVFDSVYKNDIMDGAVLALVHNMREGVADILNKKEMPLKSLAPYGDKMLAIYNEDYAATPLTLHQLDTITCDYLDGELDMEQYFQKAFECVHFEGHTTGDYMVFLIRDQLGIDAVIDSVGNIENFVDNYNKAAEKAGTYKFSDKFTKHIHDICTPARK